VYETEQLSQNGASCMTDTTGTTGGGLLSLGIKRLEHKSDHSAQSVNESTNSWSFTSTPPKATPSRRDA
jgi:hypothetical protein